MSIIDLLKTKYRAIAIQWEARREMQADKYKLSMNGKTAPAELVKEVADGLVKKAIRNERNK